MPLIEYTRKLELESGPVEETVFLDAGQIVQAVYNGEKKTLSIMLSGGSGPILEGDTAVRAMRVLRSLVAKDV